MKLAYYLQINLTFASQNVQNSSETFVLTKLICPTVNISDEYVIALT